ncbi:Uncharacterised protein [Klebsiella quasipneumoniae]|nr:Uncharacterised protein [Klebsiella quasipneumoniae]
MYRSITGSIHIAMLMCFSMKTAENMTEKAPNKTALSELRIFNFLIN